jgi:hypothetical protein
MFLNPKYLLLGILVLTMAFPGRGQRGPGSHVPVKLPALNVLQSATLTPPYSCNQNPAQGYGTTALFLSDYSQQNGPELLFNGACGSVDYFDVNTNGDQMSLIGDLGSIPLASVTTQQVFNLRKVDTPADYTKFATVANVVEGHTYAVVTNTGPIRGLFVFTVVKFVPDREVDLQFEVKDYQINLGPFERSPGFDWNK